MLRIITIDDEAKIRGMIKEIIHTYCDEGEVVGEADGVESGYKKIYDLQPDLVLLDIKMNDGTGFDLLEKFDKINFRVVFITAFQEYALKAIKFSALDYIMKPINPEELIHVINDTSKLLGEEQEKQLQHLRESLLEKDQAQKKVLLKTMESIHLLPLSNIAYCEADSGYTHFYGNGDQRIIVSKPLSEYEELFTEYGFYRVHKSYLVNLHKVERFDKEDGGTLVMEGELKVPVASRKREQLMNLLDSITF